MNSTCCYSIAVEDKLIQGWGKVDADHSAVRLQTTQVISHFRTSRIIIHLNKGFLQISFVWNIPWRMCILSIIQVRIWSNSDCQALPNTTIQNSMLCAGGEGNGTNEVRYFYPAKFIRCDPRGIVVGPSLLLRMAFTPWKESPAMGYRQSIT